MKSYLKSFNLATENDEIDFILSRHYKLEMVCYANNVYPFKIYPEKRLNKIIFEPITMFYGGNGSGKSTLLNIIAQKLKIRRTAAFNNTPFFEEYIKFCDYELDLGRTPPQESKIITSDDVFDFLLDCRSINEGIDNRREEVFKKYDLYSRPETSGFQFKSLEDYFELKERNAARSKTKSSFTSRRIPKELSGKSNGESAFAYFTSEIKENAIYLLDEPENSLSPKLQIEFSQFLEDSARFYNCQFIISTHSPFFLAMKNIKIYDLDSVPAKQSKWTELENVKIYKEFFDKHKGEF